MLIFLGTVPRNGWRQGGLVWQDGPAMTPPKPKRGRPANDPGLAKDFSGAALRAQRHVAGYTLQKLAAALALREVSVGRSTIQRWEKGVNAPNPEQFAALCDVFACRPTAFSKAPKLRQ